jgi:hypothetical protein
VVALVRQSTSSQRDNQLDQLLREFAAHGPWVSAHPDVILKMGVKEVLHRTKDLGWGTDTHLYRSAQAFRQEGMIRCYMGADKVVGFGHQLIKALIPPPPEGPDSAAAQPGPRIMHEASAEPFQALKTKMETEWTPQMMATLGIDATSLPIIWDADFLCGPRTAAGEDTYVLCEINVSSVFAIPDQAPAEVARLVASRL